MATKYRMWEVVAVSPCGDITKIVTTKTREEAMRVLDELHSQGWLGFVYGERKELVA